MQTIGDVDSPGIRARAATPAPTVLTIGGPERVNAVRSGFIGLSLEFSTVESYAGSDPAAPNPVFLQLIRNIAPGQRPSIRIGGDSTDWAWWPTPALARPRGIRIDLTPSWLAMTRTLAAALNAKLILGINLEADSRKLAGAEARTFVSRIGRAHIQSLELGNEPELYHNFGWYKNSRGQAVPGRGTGWSFSSYLADYTKIETALPRVGLAGPAIGSPGWLADTVAFTKAQRRVTTVTVHRYPLQRCGLPGASGHPATIAQLLAPAASAGLAATVISAARAAHANADSIRVDEMNSVACGGARGVSDTFASALWTVDSLFEMARIGVDGVNIHTFNSAIYGLFHVQRSRGVWSANARPDYYGLLLFAEAAPPGSHLLRVAGAHGSLRAWATRAPDRRTRVVLINDNARRSRSLTVRLPGHSRAGSLERLLAPGLRATSGVTLGGQTFGAATTTGRFAGPPHTQAITPRGRGYTVSLPPASAALLTLR